MFQKTVNATNKEDDIYHISFLSDLISSSLFGQDPRYTSLVSRGLSKIAQVPPQKAIEYIKKRQQDWVPKGRVPKSPEATSSSVKIKTLEVLEDTKLVKSLGKSVGAAIVVAALKGLYSGRGAKSGDEVLSLFNAKIGQIAHEEETGSKDIRKRTLSLIMDNLAKIRLAAILATNPDHPVLRPIANDLKSYADFAQGTVGKSYLAEGGAFADAVANMHITPEVVKDVVDKVAQQQGGPAGKNFEDEKDAKDFVFETKVMEIAPQVFQGIQKKLSSSPEMQEVLSTNAGKRAMAEMGARLQMLAHDYSRMVSKAYPQIRDDLLTKESETHEIFNFLLISGYVIFTAMAGMDEAYWKNVELLRDNDRHGFRDRVNILAGIAKKMKEVAKAKETAKKGQEKSRKTGTEPVQALQTDPNIMAFYTKVLESSRQGTKDAFDALNASNLTGTPNGQVTWNSVLDAMRNIYMDYAIRLSLDPGASVKVSDSSMKVFFTQIAVALFQHLSGEMMRKPEMQQNFIDNLDKSDPSGVWREMPSLKSIVSPAPGIASATAPTKTALRNMSIVVHAQTTSIRPAATLAMEPSGLAMAQVNVSSNPALAPFNNNTNWILAKRSVKKFLDEYITTVDGMPGLFTTIPATPTVDMVNMFAQVWIGFFILDANVASTASAVAEAELMRCTSAMDTINPFKTAWKTHLPSLGRLATAAAASKKTSAGLTSADLTTMVAKAQTDGQTAISSAPELRTMGATVATATNYNNALMCVKRVADEYMDKSLADPSVVAAYKPDDLQAFLTAVFIAEAVRASGVHKTDSQARVFWNKAVALFPGWFKENWNKFGSLANLARDAGGGGAYMSTAKSEEIYNLLFSEWKTTVNDSLTREINRISSGGFSSINERSRLNSYKKLQTAINTTPTILTHPGALKEKADIPFMIADDMVAKRVLEGIKRDESPADQAKDKLMDVLLNKVGKQGSILDNTTLSVAACILANLANLARGRY